MPTLEITNFAGKLTRYNNGPINSGMAKLNTTYGNDSFSSPGNLTFFEAPTRIDSGGTIITDLIVAGKARVESGITYLYAIGHLGRLYKIQINDPNTYNPNYNNAVLLATLSSNSPTFTRGGSMDFFGATERIYIGSDIGVTRIDFAGTNETFVGALGSWTQLVPRPLKQFVGKLYVGNGSNLAEIDSTATVTTYAKLSPGFPTNSQVRDLDTSSDGVYLESVVSLQALGDITATTPDTSSTANSVSYIIKWNGTDTGFTTFETFPGFSLTANTVGGNRQFTFGNDLAGHCIFNPTEKILSPLFAQAPLPNAVNMNANIVGWSVPEFVQGFTKASLFLYGPLDQEYSNTSWYRQFQMAASGTETNVIKMPFGLIVSNFSIGPASNGYAGGVYSTSNFYFSTLETSPSPTTDYKLYYFNTVSTGTGTPIGVYETQSQVFSNKQTVSEYRVYTKPLIAGNSFKVDLIGSDGNPITNGTTTFTVGTNCSVGDDRVRFNPTISPTYIIGCRISTLGTTNQTIVKVEIDHERAGK